MNSHPWTRRFQHPYAEVAKASRTHGHLRPTNVPIPAYSTFAVPFRWMLRERGEEIESRLPEPLSPDDEPPFTAEYIVSWHGERTRSRRQGRRAR
jgi:hypothetical protein